VPQADLLTIVITALAGFGGGAVVVAALIKWLGELAARRILQNESAGLMQKLEEVKHELSLKQTSHESLLTRELESIKHELSLQKTSYDKYLTLLLDYWDVFYRHYRLCQRSAAADAHRVGDKITFTKDEFFENLDGFLDRWKQHEGSIRLILPSPLRALHGEAIDSFNQFKDVMKRFYADDSLRREKEQAFQAIDEVKQKLEQALREFLRTEHLLK